VKPGPAGTGLISFRVATTVAILLAAVVGAWIVEYALSASTQGDRSDYRLDVVQGTTKSKSLSLADLEAMKPRAVKMQGQTEEGPPLLDVLHAAGITEFQSVVITGLGARDSGTLTLSRAQIDRDVLLDLAKRGTAKVCGPDIARGQRVRDVIRIEAR